MHFCPSWERDPSHVALSEVSIHSFLQLKIFFSSFSLLLLRVNGRGCHNLLKPYETNCCYWWLMPSSSKNCLHTGQGAGHCPAPEGTQGPLHQQEFPSGTSSNNSQVTVGYDMEVSATLQGYASPDHHWPTDKPFMQADIMFTMVPPDSFMPVRHALICEENRVPVAEQPILFSSHYRTSGPNVNFMASVSDSLVRKRHTSSLLDVIL